MKKFNTASNWIVWPWITRADVWRWKPEFKRGGTKGIGRYIEIKWLWLVISLHDNDASQDLVRIANAEGLRRSAMRAVRDAQYEQ